MFIFIKKLPSLYDHYCWADLKLQFYKDNSTIIYYDNFCCCFFDLKNAS